MASPGERNLRKNADFQDQLTNQSEDALREELGLPNVQAILTELQNTHGVRLALGPGLIDKLESIKATSSAAGAVAACAPDVCILCDQHDICQTCDAWDWCVTHDTHIVEVEEA